MEKIIERIYSCPDCSSDWDWANEPFGTPFFVSTVDEIVHVQCTICGDTGPLDAMNFKSNIYEELAE